jgi:hypothetical protein
MSVPPIALADAASFNANSNTNLRSAAARTSLTLYPALEQQTVVEARKMPQSLSLSNNLSPLPISLESWL